MMGAGTSTSPMGPTLEEFKALVDRTKPQLSPDTPLAEAYAFVGLPTGNAYTQYEVLDGLDRRLRRTFKTGHRKIWDWAKQLLDRLILEHEALGRPLDPYYELLRTILDHTRASSSPEEMYGSWPDLVQEAVNISTYNGVVHRSLYGTSMGLEVAVGRMLRARKGQFRSHPKRRKDVDEIDHLLDQAEECLPEWLEDQVQHFGGLDLLRRIFEELAGRFDAVQQRYHEVTRFGTLGMDKFQPRVPFGLLINLAVKHLHPKKPYRRAFADWQRVKETARDYALLYRVQPVTSLQSLFLDPDSLLSEMRDRALHDALFNLVQLRPTDVSRVLQGLVRGLRKRGDLDADVEQDVQCTLNVLRAIQAIAGARRGPLVLSRAEILAACPEHSPSEIDHVLLDLLVHAPGDANRSFRRVTDVSNRSVPREQRVGANLGDRPLVALNQERYLMVEHALSAPAMIEAALTQLRVRHGIDSVVGYAIETVLAEAFAGSGLRSSSGRYGSDNEWECDLIVETPARVLLIESKKKSLTREARAGRDAWLLIDSVDSLASSVLQAWRHEAHLLAHGALTLHRPGEANQTIQLNGRRIERVAVTLPDHGSFQDRVLLEQILNNQVKMQFSALTPDLAKKVNDVNQKLQELSELNQQQYAAAGCPERWDPFSNCWFLSVPQTLVLLDGVKTPEDLDERLGSVSRVTVGSKDFYFELRCADERRRLGAAAH